tara:strand:- start:161 stop:859 length:699 start_codon:yes stop_codon:yes gene_type:complete
MKSPVKLYNADCLEVMKSIADKSIDAIITDPPYGTTACKWDSVIPFDLMWEQLNRIIKPNGAIVLFGSEPFSSALRMSNINKYKYDWKWVKEQGVGQLNCKRQPLKKSEDIMIFNTKTYNPQGLKDCNIIKKAYKINTVYNQQKDYIQKKTGYPTNIIEFKRELKNRKHPTQKPVALMEYLVKTYTKENETVLDFTMGSGTTGVACCNLNRHFIGIELDKEYFKIAEERIKK